MACRSCRPRLVSVVGRVAMLVTYQCFLMCQAWRSKGSTSPSPGGTGGGNICRVPTGNRQSLVRHTAGARHPLAANRPEPGIDLMATILCVDDEPSVGVVLEHTLAK